MTEKTYQIQELETTGWVNVENTARTYNRLSKEQAKEALDYLIAEGHAETVEEATYVMEQMGEEVAVEILNEVI